MAERPDLAAVLARARKQRGLSQRKLAELSGVSNTTIASLERGKGSRGANPVKPSPDTLRSLARGLSTDLLTERVSQDDFLERYRQFMGAAGYAWLLYDPRDLASVESASDKEDAMFKEFTKQDQAEALFQNLEFAITNGAVSGRMLDTVIRIASALLDQIDPEKQYRTSTTGDEDEE